MGSALLVTLVTALAVTGTALLAVLGLAVARTRRSRAEQAALADALAATREELATVQRRLDAVERAGRAGRTDEEFVITTAGLPEPAPAEQRDVVPVTAGRFAALAAGESMVRLVALGYGVRRALAPETRNRIAFQMRRQVRHARKQRRRELKAARRTLRAAGPGARGSDAA